jgi:hypothetical protein
MCNTDESGFLHSFIIITVSGGGSGKANWMGKFLHTSLESFGGSCASAEDGANISSNLVGAQVGPRVRWTQSIACTKLYCYVK